MGAWNIGSFDNDDASDWLYELEGSEDTAVIADALDAVANRRGKYLEAPECLIAIAAAEIVSALREQPAGCLPDNAAAWIEENRNLDVSNLVPVAQAVIERIRSNSELQELWDESEHASKWHSSLESLITRLKIANQ